MPDASKLELHFYFSDHSDTMDAIVRNENEKELLAILKAVISVFNFPITIASEASQQGGSTQRWKLEGEHAPQMNAVLTLVTLFVSAKPKKESRAEMAAKNESDGVKSAGVQKKKILLDKAKKELRDSDKLNADTIKEAIAVLENNPRLIWHRSNFYKKINTYLRVERFATSLLHENEVLAGSEKIVLRKNFNSFIVNSNELPPNVDEDAVVEIVAPVLTTAKSKWKGIYKGASITFDIKDEDFKKSVFSQQIEFKNGVAIKCVLQLIQRIDGRGVIKTKSITVLNVMGISNPGNSNFVTPALVGTPATITAAINIEAPASVVKTTPVVIVQEPAPVVTPKKLPKVDERQLDMFS